MKSEKKLYIGATAAWTTVVILLLLMVASYVDRSIISLMIDPIRRDLSITDFQLSLVQGLAFAAFYALCGIPMGWLVDRYSRRLIIFISITVWSLASASCGLANSYTELLLARFLVGAAEAALIPASYSLISDIFPKERLAFPTSLLAMGSLLGSSAAFAVGGAVISRAEKVGSIALPILGILHPWKVAFIVTGLPGAVIAALIFITPNVPRLTRRPGADVSMKAFVRFVGSQKAYFSCNLLGFGAMGLLGVSLLSWFPTYLLRAFGIGIAAVGGLTGAVSGAAGLAGFLFSGWIIDRCFSKGVVTAHFLLSMIAVIAMTILAVALFASDNSTVAFTLYGAILFFASITGVAALSHVQIVTPNEFRGRTSAMFMLVFILSGAGLGPSVVAFFTDFVFRDAQRVGSSITLTFAIFGPISALILGLGLKPARRAVERATQLHAPSAVTDGIGRGVVGQVRAVR